MLKRLQAIDKGKGKDKKNAAKPHCYIGLAALKVRIYNRYTETKRGYARIEVSGIPSFIFNFSTSLLFQACPLQQT